MSIASRVVPGMSDTMHRSSPRMRLTREDFPAFGLPMTATEIVSSSSGALSKSGRASRTASRTSPLPLPCREEIAMGSMSKPSS